MRTWSPGTTSLTEAATLDETTTGVPRAIASRIPMRVVGTTTDALHSVGRRSGITPVTRTPARFPRTRTPRAGSPPGSTSSARGHSARTFGKIDVA